MSAFRLPSGATAPYAKLAGACMEIVFVGIRLCDRLKYARLNALYSAEADARRPLSRAHSTRIVRLGVSLGGRRGNLAASRIGWRLLL
jgi:hypothetical protein